MLLSLCSYSGVRFEKNQNFEMMKKNISSKQLDSYLSLHPQPKTHGKLNKYVAGLKQQQQLQQDKHQEKKEHEFPWGETCPRLPST